MISIFSLYVKILEESALDEKSGHGIGDATRLPADMSGINVTTYTVYHCFKELYYCALY